MILGAPQLDPARPLPQPSGLTIDEVFRLVAEQRPDRLALVDAPNREAFTEGVPRRLTYAEADRLVTAIAGQLRRLGLPTDAIIGIQLPNVVENVLAMLGVLRAGMIVAPMPLLWRRADAVTALARVGAKALITCSHVREVNHAHLAMRVAAEVFSIDYVCGFGKSLPDGVVSFDALLASAKRDPMPPLDCVRQDNATAHVAVITFDVGDGGIIPVARNHRELLAGGLGVLLESRLAQGGSILSTLVPATFAGITLALLPWILSGGTLVLHHPFDADVFARQGRVDRCSALAVPAAVAFCLAEAGIIDGNGPKTVIAAWRAPERLAFSPSWPAVLRDGGAVFVDAAIFGETGLLPARRGNDGKPGPVPLGLFAAPREGSDAVVIVELARTSAGTLALRGPMVPHHAFPPGVERTGLSHLKVGPGGLIDTSYACRVDSVAKAMQIVGSPSGIVSVGGYRLPLHDLSDVVGRIDTRATLAAHYDPLIGQRLIGDATDRDVMQAALGAVGVNPLVVAAFRDRREREVAQAPAAAG